MSVEAFQRRLAFRFCQRAHGDGVSLLLPFKEHLQINRPSITEHKPAYKSGSLSVGTGLKANLYVSVSDLIRLAGSNLSKEQGHTIPLVARNPDGCPRVALDDDRHLSYEIPSTIGALAGPEVTSGAVEADIAHHRRPLAPSSVRVARNRGVASRYTHPPPLGHVIGIWHRTPAILLPSAAARRCDKRRGQQNGPPSCNQNPASQITIPFAIHLRASSGSGVSATPHTPR
jgi:hypothetical protein